MSERLNKLHVHLSDIREELVWLERELYGVAVLPVKQAATSNAKPQPRSPFTVLWDTLEAIAKLTTDKPLANLIMEYRERAREYDEH